MQNNMDDVEASLLNDTLDSRTSSPTEQCLSAPPYRPIANALPRAFSACALAAGPPSGREKEQKATQRKLFLALILAFAFMVIEIVGGVKAGSLAIITDAAHLLSDVSGFVVSLIAAFWASRASPKIFSYGYHRLEVLGALASILSVWVVTGILLYEAISRLIHPEPVNGKLMFILALVGVAVNLLLVWILGGHTHGGGNHAHHDHAHQQDCGDRSDEEQEHQHTGGSSHENINLRSAVIHVIGDLVQSLGVAIAGALIWWHQGDTRWALADPICTFFFAILVVWTTIAVFRDIYDVLMERVPRGMCVDSIERDILRIEGVHDVHDLHVWSLTPGIPLLAAHVEAAHGFEANEVLHKLTVYCRSIGVEHSTIQIAENGLGCPCST